MQFSLRVVVLRVYDINYEISSHFNLNVWYYSKQGDLADALKNIKQLEQAVATASKKIEYLGALGDALMEGFHTDLELVTDDGCSIKVHKVIMVRWRAASL